VVINGRPLDQNQIAQFRSRYGMAPVPGEYWYDGRSGLYGVIGSSSAGFMLPGHEFGSLKADASRGNTGVYLNGRNLPQDELMVMNFIWQSYIQPGRYWLDGNGNLGYEGSSYPVGNLLVQIQALSQIGYVGGGGTGGGGGGDNIWSSRVSAGNYYSDGSAGYVSVPGYGPVGYGN
jgi:hypothetical protein